MKEHYTLFCGEMVRAIIAGRKWMTRRVVSPNNSLIDGKSARTKEGRALWDKLDWAMAHIVSDGDGEPFEPFIHVPEAKPLEREEWVMHQIHPYVRVGDRMLVKETWSPDATSMYPCPPVWYRASDSIESNGVHTCPKDRILPWADCLACWEERNQKFKWRSSMLMPRHAIRLRLDVSAAFPQRLQDISEEDALAEGIDRREPEDWDWKDMAPGFAPPLRTTFRDYIFDSEWSESPIASFRSLWTSLSDEAGKGWSDNPLVWVRAFKRN